MTQCQLRGFSDTYGECYLAWLDRKGRMTRRTKQTNRRVTLLLRLSVGDTACAGRQVCEISGNCTLNPPCRVANVRFCRRPSVCDDSRSWPVSPFASTVSVYPNHYLPPRHAALCIVHCALHLAPPKPEKNQQLEHTVSSPGPPRQNGSRFPGHSANGERGRVLLPTQVVRDEARDGGSRSCIPPRHLSFQSRMSA